MPVSRPALLADRLSHADHSPGTDPVPERFRHIAARASAGRDDERRVLALCAAALDSIGLSPDSAERDVADFASCDEGLAAHG